MFDIYNTQDDAILLRVYTKGTIDHYLRMETRGHVAEWLVSKWVKSDVHGVSGGYKEESDILCSGSFEKCAGYLLNYTVALTAEAKS